MKKILKMFLFSMFLFIIFTLGNSVKANSIQEISMDIYVDANGNAQVTEIWKCNTSQGTEVYHPYYNLGNSKIENLSVSEGETQYTTLSSWKTSGNLSSKAYRCGINMISNGVELCWGISSYGNHTYTVKYTITNFVSELSDSQMIYWTLIPYDFSNSIGNVYIKIYADFPIADTTDVWGYGNTGTAYVYDGYIEMQSDGVLPQSDYMTILVKFPLGTFQTNNHLNQGFNDYYKMAEEGAVHNPGSSYDDEDSVFSNAFFVVLFLLPYIAVVGIFVLIFATKTKYNYGPDGKSISKDVAYFRDIPCQSDLFKAYYIAYQYGILKNKTDLLGAIILKWLKDGMVQTMKKEKTSIFNKEDTYIVLPHPDSINIENVKEKELFSMLYTASKDGILENKEFERWCSNHYEKILSWFDNLILSEQNRLIGEGYITFEKQKVLKIFTRKVYTFDQSLKQEAVALAGLKRYLLDYSLIHEREAMEVHIFEDYLVYAQLLGIAKAVAKQFKELYPEMIEQTHYVSYDNVLFIHMCASSGISHANSAQSRAESYSSGGGGFSSSGGGGGSFGGGGGRRWLPLKFKRIKAGTILKKNLVNFKHRVATERGFAECD